MAPIRTPAKKRREADYSGIGHYGRKTGVTVPDLGPRDEHGLEPVDGLFSSPRRDSLSINETSQNDHAKEMDLVNSTPRDTSDLVASLRRRTQLPPKSRSPIRTSLGASPRRSVGDRLALTNTSRTAEARSGEESFFSRLKRSNLTSGRTYIAQEEHLSSHLSDPTAAEPSINSARRNGTKSKVFQLISNGIAQSVSSPEPEEPALDSEDEFPHDDASLPALSFDASDSSSPSAPRQSTPAKREGRDNGAKHSPVLNLKRPRDDDTENYSRRRNSDTTDSALEGSNTPIRQSPLKSKNAVRKSKVHANKKSHSRNNVNALSRSKDATSDLPSRPKSANKRVKVNANASVSRKQEAGAGQQHSDPATIMLRSGRTSVKPLAYWRGEQIVYEPPSLIGKNLLPGGYKGVDPGRNVNESILRPTKRKNSRYKTANRNNTQAEDSERESWEYEGDTPGVLSAGVFVWDPDTQNSLEDAHEEIELALAPNALDNRTQSAKGGTFRFGKTLTLPFFHSGIVDLPPGGEKRPKNSKKNHMVFWVFSGRVRVDVSGNLFSVGCGGMWQVPRGNSYGLTNPYNCNVRIFFAQGSYMEQPEDEAALTSAATVGD